MTIAWSIDPQEPAWNKVIRIIVGAALIIAGAVTGNFTLILAGVQLVGSALLEPSKSKNRAAAAAQLQLGEQPRQAVLGRAAVAGSLVDAFNYGGKYGTDWEVLVIALADHRCDALEGFFVDDTYVAFSADGNVAGFNNQLQVFWRDGQWAQTVPTILTTNGPGWTANDRGRGVAYVVVAYKADASDAKDPIWPSGRPRFRWVVRGLRCYQARKDSTVGGSGAHRRDNPATWEWTENPIDIRYNWVRGIYAGDLVAQPEMLLVGRGLSAIEAPPANVFARANLCDETVGGQARYKIGGVVASNEPFIDVESDFAAAVAGTISQPEGAVEVDPGQAKSVVATFTDDDLLVGSTVSWNERILGQQDDGWINTVAARFVDPAQRWNVRSAPVRRDTADVIADGAPRETQPQLDLVTNQPQAQRIAEIIRRFGRLWGRATVTLPPRFAFIEEGDWVAWQSNRRFGGATLTFRVEAWGSNPAWHHQLTLRQISSSIFSDTAPLSDGVIASTQAEPPVVAAPAAGVWSAAAVLLGSGSVRVPNLRVAGTPDDPAAQFVVFEYVPQTAAPDVTTIWTFASSSRPDVRLLDIPVPEGGTYYVAISYVVDGIQGARRVIGPISTAGLSYADGSPIAPVAPANANLVQFSRMEGGLGWFNTSSMTVTAGVQPATVNGRVFIRTEANATAAGQILFTQTSAAYRFLVNGNERLSVAAALEALSLSGGPALLGWGLYVEFFDGSGAAIPGAPFVASGAGDSLSSVRREAFMTTPANAVRGHLVAYAQASGAGSVRLSIAEPMIASVAAGQTVHPTYTPGPNALDGAQPNNLITVSGGTINGIGTGNGTPVDNTRNILRDTLSNLPGTGAFVGQQFAAIDTKDVLRWSGSAWVAVSDVTGTINGPADVPLNYAADLTLTSPLPVTATYQLVVAGGSALTSGVTWAVSIVSGTFSGTAPSIVGSGSGQLRINSAMTSPEAQLRITATVGGKTYPGFTVKVPRIVAPPSAGGAAVVVSDALTSMISSSFVRMHAGDISITLPAGVTSVALVASGDLAIDPVTPTGTTTVEGKWQRESSPGTWSDVGSTATSSPIPDVYDTGLLDGSGNPVYAANPGSISCNRTATGLSAGSTQKFRFMARVSAGNVRNVTGTGTVSATA